MPAVNIVLKKALDKVSYVHLSTHTKVNYEIKIDFFKVLDLKINKAAT
jgi:hypothetical protein